MTNSESATRSQLVAVILLDCLTECNGLRLSRDQYRKKLDEMMLRRIGQTVPLELLESL